MSSTDKHLPYHLIAKLGAIALFLSTIEYMIPKPLPFMRLGLANIPIMLSLELLSPLGIFLLLLMKVLGQALINGTLFSYVALFSLSGTIASASMMFLIVKLFRRHVSYIGISMAGAICSNLVQLLLSRYMLLGPSAWLFAPPFLIIGAVSSLLLGFFTQRFIGQSSWYASHKSHDREASVSISPDAYRIDYRIISGLLILPAFLLQRDLTGSVIMTGAAIVLALFHGRKIRVVPNLILLFSITFANLLQKNGLVLTEFLGFPITAGAVELGVRKASLLIGLVYLSQFMVSNRPTLPGRFGALVSLQFFYFEQVTERWKDTGSLSLLNRIDALLALLEDADHEQGQKESIDRKPDQLWLYALVTAVFWTLLILF